MIAVAVLAEHGQAAGQFPVHQRSAEVTLGDHVGEAPVVEAHAAGGCEDWIEGEDADRSSGRIATEERALRPLEYLDLLHVGQIETVGDLVRLVHAIDVHRHVGIVARIGLL